METSKQGTNLTRLCGKCKIEHSLENFSNNKSEKTGKNFWCKQCMNAYYLLNKDKRAEKYNSGSYWVTKEYGISKEQYDEILNLQDSKCRICEKHADEFKKRLAVDHNHTTGEIRGLLCYACNTAIGLFKENQNSLLNAYKYLEISDSLKFKESSVNFLVESIIIEDNNKLKVKNKTIENGN